MHDPAPADPEEQTQPLRLSFLALPFLLWRIGYLLMSGQRGRFAGTRFSDHLLFLALLAERDPVVQARLRERRKLALAEDLPADDDRPTDPMLELDEPA